MYTHPAFIRRGIGRLVLDASGAASRAEGFAPVVLSATAGGVPLYEACGYVSVEPISDSGVPMMRMEKALV